MQDERQSDPAPRASDAVLRPNRLRVVVSLILVLVLGTVAWLLLWPRQTARDTFTGYVVADNLYLSAPVAGTVDALFVKRGQRIAAGAPLFRIDPTSLAARADQASAQIGQAAAEADADRAALAKMRAALANAETEVRRTATDLEHYRSADRGMRGAVALQQLDQARFAAESAVHQRNAARDDVLAAEARINAARAQVARNKAALTDAQRQVAQLSPNAPAAGTVEDILFQSGEWAPANAPVISLVPDGEVKVRFYVPQGLVSRYRRGARLAISCDGCAANMEATVDRVATRPEYTPPVIYSLKQRDKLVFMVEAVPARPHLLTPGQPIDVSTLSADHTQ